MNVHPSPIVFGIPRVKSTDESGKLNISMAYLCQLEFLRFGKKAI